MNNIPRYAGAKGKRHELLRTMSRAFITVVAIGGAQTIAISKALWHSSIATPGVYAHGLQKMLTARQRDLKARTKRKTMML